MKKKISQKELIKQTNLVPNNPAHDRQQDSNDSKNIQWGIDHTLYDDANLNRRTAVADRVLEVFRNSKSRLNGYRTYQGHWKHHDEPTSGGDKELELADRIRNNILKNRSAAGKSRLKQQNKVPKKNGNPMWEQIEKIQEETDLNYADFRRIYYAAKVMSFRNWLEIL